MEDGHETRRESEPAPAGASQPPAGLAPPPTAPARPAADDVDSDDDASVSDVEMATYRHVPKFKTFRKHARDVYQSLATNETLWPCKSVEVMPYFRDMPNGCVEQTVVTGTTTAGEEQNFIKITSLVLPSDHTAELARCEYDEELRELGQFGMAPQACRFKLDMLMAHEGDVRKVRVMPHNPNVIASSSSTDCVYVFDRATILRTAPPNNPPRPLLPLMPPKPDKSAPAEARRDFNAKRLKESQEMEKQRAWDAKRHAPQHKVALGGAGIRNAWALDFSRAAPGRLLVGGNEGVATWALGELKKTDAGSDVPADYRSAASVTSVNDAKWSPFDASVITYAAGDATGGTGRLGLLDTRMPDPASVYVGAEFGAVANSLDFSPHEPDIFAVGGSNGGVHFFDIRSVAAGPVRSVYPHAAGSLVTVSWCPHDPDYVATGSSDTNAAIVHVPTGATVFVHTGHTDAVMDVCWSPHDAFAGQVLSIDDNAVCAWKPRNQFFAPPTA